MSLEEFRKQVERENPELEENICEWIENHLILSFPLVCLGFIIEFFSRKGK
jgi:hypothetical protein